MKQKLAQVFRPMARYLAYPMGEKTGVNEGKEQAMRVIDAVI
ncbi:MAG: hypothetical protein SWE60_22725 [Thermodesulfobacteriota bacterium]|nr:hypothetical protein [Thermodesulfobacteriota bacterium]